jgi:hypothetical protein
VDNALRYAMVFPEDDFTQNTQDALKELQRSGYEKMRVKNWFLGKDPAFRSVSAVMATEGGFTFTVQFHTPASHQAKLDNHETHKRRQQEWRQTNPDLQRLQEYEHSLKERYRDGKVPIPRNINRIHNFAPLGEVGMPRGPMRGGGEGLVAPPPSGSGKRAPRVGTAARAQISTGPQSRRSALRGLPTTAVFPPDPRTASDTTTPNTGLADGGDRGRHPDLDRAYGSLVEPSWVKPEEKDTETSGAHFPRINPVWYQLAEMPPKVLLEHTGAKWLYSVDADGGVRIGSGEVGRMLSVEELDEQYRYHHRGQQPSGEQRDQFREQLDGLGHPTIAVGFNPDDGRIATAEPQARVSGEIVWNGQLERWEVNINSGRYMHGKTAWAKYRKPRPSDEDSLRWLGNVADQLSKHLGVPVVPAAKLW